MMVYMQTKSLSKYYVFLLWASSLVALSYSFYAQYIDHLKPCSLCLIQRYIYLAIALCPALFLTFKNRKLKIVIMTLLILGSVVVAGYNVLLENRVIDPIFSCATPINIDDIMQLLPEDCSTKQYAMLGFSFAEINFFFSLIMFLLGIYTYGKETTEKESI
ncbi:MAG: disulfide bond formation protein B [Sphingobacteriia bacterium]|nr:disulfide bond formation protein B [Sphingobacteriia bacterium]